MCSTCNVWSSDIITVNYNNVGQLVSCICVPLTMRQNSDFLCDHLGQIFVTRDNCSTHILETVFSIYINHWFWNTSLPIKTQKTEVIIFQALLSYVLIFRSFLLFVLHTKILLYIHSWNLITHLGTSITVKNHGILQHWSTTPDILLHYVSSRNNSWFSNNKIPGWPECYCTWHCTLHCMQNKEHCMIFFQWQT